MVIIHNAADTWVDSLEPTEYMQWLRSMRPTIWNVRKSHSTRVKSTGQPLLEKIESVVGSAKAPEKDISTKAPVEKVNNFFREGFRRSQSFRAGKTGTGDNSPGKSEMDNAKTSDRTQAQREEDTVAYANSHQDQDKKEATEGGNKWMDKLNLQRLDKNSMFNDTSSGGIFDRSPSDTQDFHCGPVPWKGSTVPESEDSVSSYMMTSTKSTKDASSETNMQLMKPVTTRVSKDDVFSGETHSYHYQSGCGEPQPSAWEENVHVKNVDCDDSIVNNNQRASSCRSMDGKNQDRDLDTPDESRTRSSQHRCVGPNQDNGENFIEGSKCNALTEESCKTDAMGQTKKAEVDESVRDSRDAEFDLCDRTTESDEVGVDSVSLTSDMRSNDTQSSGHTNPSTDNQASTKVHTGVYPVPSGERLSNRETARSLPGNQDSPSDQWTSFNNEACNENNVKQSRGHNPSLAMPTEYNTYEHSTKESKQTQDNTLRIGSELDSALLSPTAATTAIEVENNHAKTTLQQRKSTEMETHEFRPSELRTTDAQQNDGKRVEHEKNDSSSLTATKSNTHSVESKPVVETHEGSCVNEEENHQRIIVPFPSSIQASTTLDTDNVYRGHKSATQRIVTSYVDQRRSVDENRHRRNESTVQGDINSNKKSFLAISTLNDSSTHTSENGCQSSKICSRGNTSILTNEHGIRPSGENTQSSHLLSAVMGDISSIRMSRAQTIRKPTSTSSLFEQDLTKVTPKLRRHFSDPGLNYIRSNSSELSLAEETVDSIKANDKAGVQRKYWGNILTESEAPVSTDTATQYRPKSVEPKHHTSWISEFSGAYASQDHQPSLLAFSQEEGIDENTGEWTNEFGCLKGSEAMHSSLSKEKMQQKKTKEILIDDFVYPGSANKIEYPSSSSSGRPAASRGTEFSEQDFHSQRSSKSGNRDRLNNGGKTGNFSHWNSSSGSVPSKAIHWPGLDETNVVWAHLSREDNHESELPSFPAHLEVPCDSDFESTSSMSPRGSTDAIPGERSAASYQFETLKVNDPENQSRKFLLPNISTLSTRDLCIEGANYSEDDNFQGVKTREMNRQSRGKLKRSISSLNEVAFEIQGRYGREFIRLPLVSVARANRGKFDEAFERTANIILSSSQRVSHVVTLDEMKRISLGNTGPFKLHLLRKRQRRSSPLYSDASKTLADAFTHFSEGPTAKIRTARSMFSARSSSPRNPIPPLDLSCLESKSETRPRTAPTGAADDTTSSALVESPGNALKFKEYSFSVESTVDDKKHDTPRTRVTIDTDVMPTESWTQKRNLTKPKSHIVDYYGRKTNQYHSLIENISSRTKESINSVNGPEETYLESAFRESSLKALSKLQSRAARLHQKGYISTDLQERLLSLLSQPDADCTTTKSPLRPKKTASARQPGDNPRKRMASLKSTRSCGFNKSTSFHDACMQSGLLNLSSRTDACAKSPTRPHGNSSARSQRGSRRDMATNYSAIPDHADKSFASDTKHHIRNMEWSFNGNVFDDIVRGNSPGTE